MCAVEVRVGRREDGEEEEEEGVGRTEERSTLFLFFGDQGMIPPPRRGER